MDIIDTTEYANEYADLKKAFGYDKLKLQKHWDKHGKNEGRRHFPMEIKEGPSITLDLFDHISYSKMYPELKHSIGSNKAKLYKHWVTNGCKELREAYAKPLQYPEANTSSPHIIK